MFNRVAKPVSAVVASILRWLVSITKTFSGFCAMFSPGSDAIIMKAASPFKQQPTRPAPQKSPNHSEWEKCVSEIVSLAKQEIAEILPGWSIDIHTLNSPDIQCHEFVLRAETPADWSLNHCDRDGHIVQGCPPKQWGARLSIPYRDIHMGKSSVAPFVSKRLFKFANDIRREAIALGCIDNKPARFDYRVCDTCNAFLTKRESHHFTCSRCLDARSVRFRDYS